MPRTPSILFVNSGSSIKSFTLEKAKEMGLTTILVKDLLDWEEPYVDHFIPADTYNHSEVLDKVTSFYGSHRIHGVVTFWERDVVLAAKISQQLGVPGLDIQSAKRARDKYLMRTTLARHGLPGPRFRKVQNLKDLRDGLNEIGFPAVLKPVSGAGGKNVIKIDSGDERELENTFETLYRLSHPCHDPVFHHNPGKFLLEEYMEGDEVSVEGFVDSNTTHLIAVTDKSPLQGPYFVESGDTMPSLQPKRVQQAIMDTAKAGIRALGYRNCGIHGEIKLTQEGPRIIEMAARLGGDYICDFVEMIHKVDMVKAVLQIGLGQKPQVRQRPSFGVVKGKYFLPKSSGTIARLDGIKEARKLPGVQSVRILSKKGDTVSVPPEGFDYIGWLVARGETSIEVDKITNRALDRIEIEIQ